MTNLNYLLISGPLKRNMSITNDLSSSFMWGVLFSDSDDKSTPPTAAGLCLLIVAGGASPLLQCDVQLVSSTRPLLLLS